MPDPLTADDIIELLQLEPHPEGGAFVRTWLHDSAEDGRGFGSAIYFLLRDGGSSTRHRIDADEMWHHYAGAPLELSVEPLDGGPPVVHMLGPDLASGQRPQLVVPAHAWQSARTLGDWTLVGCTVTPAFTMEGFELDGGA